MGPIFDEDSDDNAAGGGDAVPVLVQLRLEEAAVREMQRRAADLGDSVERRVEDEHS